MYCRYCTTAAMIVVLNVAWRNLRCMVAGWQKIEVRNDIWWHKQWMSLLYGILNKVLNERLTDHTRLGTRPAHEFSELTISESRVRSNICSYTAHNVAGWFFGPHKSWLTLVNTQCTPLGSRACLKRGPEIRFPPQLNHYTGTEAARFRAGPILYIHVNMLV